MTDLKKIVFIDWHQWVDQYWFAVLSTYTRDQKIWPVSVSMMATVSPSAARVRAGSWFIILSTRDLVSVIQKIPVIFKLFLCRAIQVIADDLAPEGTRSSCL